MQNSIPTRRAVLIFLVLHTAIILMLSFILKRSDAPDANPVILIASIAVIIATTLYTAHRITESINEKIERRANKIAQYAERLQTKANDLDNYASELKRWASDMTHQQMALQQRVLMINDYGNRMNELAGRMSASSGRQAAAKQPCAANNTVKEEL